ncbi:MAG: hypothetical protein HC769_28735 [Cyanobacteria bacterium CRU_2_1]|nr:hypothetical protein [Cyanobacteria bacterium CRU_2_1]
MSPALVEAIRALQAQFPIGQSGTTLVNWWQKQGQNWLMELRHCLKQHRNLAKNGQFNWYQRSRLQQYYQAHQLLLDCLQGNCQVTDTYRQQLEATLLLAEHATPADNIKARQFDDSFKPHHSSPKLGRDTSTNPNSPFGCSSPRIDRRG